MEGRRGFLLGGFMIVAVLARLECATATDYTVGGSKGWTGPPNIAAGYYNDWASNISFKGGDRLVFAFNGTHNVAIVSKADYDNCTKVESWFGGGEAITYTLPLDANGMSYFICTVDSHCAGGQKLAINVTSSVSAEAPNNSSASPLAVGILLVLFLSSVSAMLMP